MQVSTENNIGVIAFAMEIISSGLRKNSVNGLKLIKFVIFSCFYFRLISSIPLPIDTGYDQVQNSISNNNGAVPFWQNACGMLTNLSAPLNTDDVNATYARSLRKIRQHIRMAQQQLTGSNSRSLLFLNTYKGLTRENYSSNWIPDINSVTPILESKGVQTLTNYGEKLSVLHRDLQRFAVAFEQIHMDEATGTERKTCLSALIEYLRELLCEVESTIVELGVQVPETIPRSLMSAEERTLSKRRSSSESISVSTTRKIIRDNGVLLKYREFLEAWLKAYKIARRTNSDH